MTGGPPSLFFFFFFFGTMTRGRGDRSLPSPGRSAAPLVAVGGRFRGPSLLFFLGGVLAGGSQFVVLRAGSFPFPLFCSPPA